MECWYHAAEDEKKLSIRAEFGGQHCDKNFDRVGREINAQSLPHSEHTVSVTIKLQKLYFVMLVKHN